MKVVSVEILVGRWRGEEEVEKFENEQLEGGLAFSIQKENDVFAECFISGSLSGKDFHDLIR